MRIVHNKFLPFKGYEAVNLFGILFCRKGTAITADVVRHERIHTAQMREMLFVFFYLWYFVEWLVRIPMKGRAYTSISFEREAYRHMYDEHYLKHRKPFAWWKYLKRKRRG